MIIYRVADGTAWSKQSIESQTLTSFRAASGPPKGRSGRDVQFTTDFSVSDAQFGDSKLEAGTMPN